MSRNWTAIAILVCGTSATIAEAQSGGDRVLEGVTACRSLTDDRARLTCFDRAAASLAEARAAKNIVVLDRKEVRERKRSLFGLPLPDIRLFGKDDEDQNEVAQIDSTVVSATRYGRGLWTVRLEDGSIWRTAAPLRFDPEVKAAVTIKRSALGGYRGTFGQANTVQVERLR